MNPKTNFNRKRLDQLIKELHQAGFHVTSGEGEFVVLGREPCRESGATIPSSSMPRGTLGA